MLEGLSKVVHDTKDLGIFHFLFSFSLILSCMVPNTKLLISWKLLNTDVCFQLHQEALFNTLILTINRL